MVERGWLQVISNRPLPPLLERLSTGQGPVLGFLRAYTEWLQGLKKLQEDREYQKDLLRQLDKAVASENTEKWVGEQSRVLLGSGKTSTGASVSTKSVSTMKPSGGQQDE